MLTVCAALLPVRAQTAAAQMAADCEQAGRAAEQTYALPRGLLLAIGRVESGRWDSTAGRVTPWPWSIDFDGTARLFDNRMEALRGTRAVQAAAPRNIDVGCFQISLRYHPQAFTDLDQAFDPAANADYAARFLVSLKNRLGSWPAAVAAYHSADPGLGVPYRERVFAAWPDAPAAPAAAPAIVEREPIPGVYLWTPSPDGGAGTMIAIGGRAPSLLPRVITPSQ
jgi:soluble lytic murein transglycosylase-like protein